MPFFNGATRADIPSGTLMLFQQTAAPTGWVKQTSHDNKALRVVSGTAGSGGSTAFTSVFVNQTPTITLSGLSAAATTLSTAQMPSHTHDTSIGYGNGYGGSTYVLKGPEGILFFPSFTSTGAGSNGSHSHSVSGSGSASAITLNVQYVDLIIASKA